MFYLGKKVRKACQGESNEHYVRCSYWLRWPCCIAVSSSVLHFATFCFLFLTRSHFSFFPSIYVSLLISLSLQRELFKYGSEYLATHVLWGRKGIFLVYKHKLKSWHNLDSDLVFSPKNSQFFLDITSLILR